MTKKVDEKSEAYNNFRGSSSSIKNIMNNKKVNNVAFENMPKGIVFGHLITAAKEGFFLDLWKKKKKKKKNGRAKR